MLGITSIDKPSEQQFKEFFKDTSTEGKIIPAEKIIRITKAWNKYLNQINYSIVYTNNKVDIFQNNKIQQWSEE